MGLRALGIVRVRVRDLGIGFWVSGYVTSQMLTIMFISNLGLKSIKNMK